MKTLIILLAIYTVIVLLEEGVFGSQFHYFGQVLRGLMVGMLIALVSKCKKI